MLLLSSGAFEHEMIELGQRLQRSLHDMLVNPILQ